MNRKQKRVYAKRMKHFGLSKDEIVNRIVQIEEIKPGVKVKINAEKINKKKNLLSDEYISFVESNKDKIFTVDEKEDGLTYTLVEDTTVPKWLFVATDLIKE